MSLDDDRPQPPDPGAAGHGPAAPRDSGAGLRQLTDAQTLRALAHPVRIALVEQLSVVGPMTATQLGEEIGESPTTCSFHLRQLAKYGFVEEAGGGRGRARPWRMTTIGMRIAATHDDPETAIAAGILVRMVRERQLERYRTWLETRATYPRRWREAFDDSEYVFYVTIEELEQLNEELQDILLNRFRERMTDPSRRPPGSVPVETLLFSFPLTMPPESDDQPSGEGAG